MHDWLVILSVSGVASFVHCLLGFGDSLIAMPILLMFYDLKVADTIANNYAFIIGIVLTGYSFKELKNSKFEAIVLFVMYTLFTIVGLMVLHSIHQNPIIIVLSIVLILYPLIVYMSNSNPKFTINKYFAFVFGSLAGFLGSTTNVDGPALVAYGQFRKLPKNVFIAIMQPIFLWGSIIDFFGYYKMGLFNLRLTLIMLASLPIVLLNAYICNKIRNKISQAAFVYVVTSVISISGMIMFIRHVF